MSDHMIPCYFMGKHIWQLTPEERDMMREWAETMTQPDERQPTLGELAGLPADFDGDVIVNLFIDTTMPPASDAPKKDTGQ